MAFFNGATSAETTGNTLTGFVGNGTNELDLDLAAAKTAFVSDTSGSNPWKTLATSIGTADLVATRTGLGMAGESDLNGMDDTRIPDGETGMNSACVLFESTGESTAAATTPVDASSATTEFKLMIGPTLISEFVSNISAACVVTNLASALISFDLSGATGNNS